MEATKCLVRQESWRVPAGMGDECAVAITEAGIEQRAQLVEIYS
jgi:hypothetical protein